MGTDHVSDDTWNQRCGVRHKAWVQVRYHKSRQRFWDLADKLTKVTTIVIGGTVFAQYAKDILVQIGGVLSALGLLALIFGYTDRKQAHKELAEKFAELAASVEQVPAGELTPGKTATWDADYLRLCAKAPPQLKWLTLICEREQATADGNPNFVGQLPFYQRWFCHFI